MACSACGAETVDFLVPDADREYAPEGAHAASICSRCLTVEAADEGCDDPDFTRVSGAFPTRPDAAVPLALALGCCESLATNRTAIETLLERIERAGVDPLLALDRLLAEPSVEPAIDLERRRVQLESLLY